MCPNWALGRMFKVFVNDYWGGGVLLLKRNGGKLERL